MRKILLASAVLALVSPAHAHTRAPWWYCVNPFTQGYICRSAGGHERIRTRRDNVATPDRPDKPSRPDRPDNPGNPGKDKPGKDKSDKGNGKGDKGGKGKDRR